MTEALFYCLSYIGRGNPKQWQAEAKYPGGFSLPDSLKPYTRCEYSSKGLGLFQGQKRQFFTASMCDAVASKVKKILLLAIRNTKERNVKQLNLGL